MGAVNEFGGQRRICLQEAHRSWDCKQQIPNQADHNMQMIGAVHKEHFAVVTWCTVHCLGDGRGRLAAGEHEEVHGR